MGGCSGPKKTWFSDVMSNCEEGGVALLRFQNGLVLLRLRGRREDEERKVAFVQYVEVDINFRCGSEEYRLPLCDMVQF